MPARAGQARVAALLEARSRAPSKAMADEVLRWLR
jgi:hypothetical protein